MIFIDQINVRYINIYKDKNNHYYWTAVVKYTINGEHNYEIRKFKHYWINPIKPSEIRVLNTLVNKINNRRNNERQKHYS